MPALDRSLADCRYWGQAMIYRFLRLTPMYAFTLMIYIYVYPLMGDGPNCSNTSNHDHNVISRDVSDRLLVVAGMTGDERQVGFQWKDPDFLSRNPDFLSRNPDFLSKNPDFLSRNPDFLSKNVVFTIKQAGPGGPLKSLGVLLFLFGSTVGFLVFDKNAITRENRNTRIQEVRDAYRSSLFDVSAVFGTVFGTNLVLFCD